MATIMPADNSTDQTAVLLTCRTLCASIGLRAVPREAGGQRSDYKCQGVLYQPRAAARNHCESRISSSKRPLAAT